MLLVTRNSKETIADSFSVTFRDGCSTFKNDPSFLQEEEEIFLWQEKILFFEKPVLDCPPEIATPPILRLIDEDTGEALSPMICELDVSEENSVG